VKNLKRGHLPPLLQTTLGGITTKTFENSPLLNLPQAGGLPSFVGQENKGKINLL
jgi:hypothetical protein